MYFLYTAIVIVILLIFSFVSSAIECEAKWKDSGRKYEWSLFAGCRVEDSKGKLIPENNIRDIQ